MAGISGWVIEQVKISDLKLAEYNPRVITPEEREGLKNSILTFGLVENIVINKDRTVIGGHQRISICEELGWETVPCYVVDLDKHDEKKLNVLLNSQAISGSYDNQKLKVILEELKLDEDYKELRLDVLEPLHLEDKQEKGGIDADTTYRVFIDCDDEEDQEETFNALKELGYDVKVIQL